MTGNMGKIFFVFKRTIPLLLNKERFSVVSCSWLPKKAIFIAPAYSRVRYRSSNFRPSVRSSVRPSTFTSKFSFLDIRDSCESETLHSNCP